MSSDGKTVFITGCTDGGIGNALAKVLHERGFHIFAGVRDLKKIPALKDLPHVTPVILDVTKADQIKAAVKTVADATGGKLDVLINNAAINNFMPLLDERLDTIRGLFEVNFIGPIAITQAFAPLLIEAKGLAVFITSIAGYINTPYMGPYSASKRGLELVADALRLELAPFDVGVLSVVTGAVQSNGQTYFDDLRLPEGSLYKPIEETIRKRAQGSDGVERMPTTDYAGPVVDEIVKRTTGSFWYGGSADMVRNMKTNVDVPFNVMDAHMSQGNGLDVLKK
ncbi:hypothetical protein BDV96DRAFT_616274 [Lophiotrema nucula]|uniref:Hydroxybutyrate dehydrogenase n=1 Tax=Lophiotrema nucula TaxID=690887 RepID=A0A6A5YQG7_9PLEO|nr:hypothetical protein BDV96DRAFT_616274 [Lophiotrema nucula]